MSTLSSGRRHRGVSLIEVLVSLVILSLGVLAVVALQLIAKRNNADAGQRTIAAQLAYDIIERMRANSSKASLAEYQKTITTAAPQPDQACSDGAPCNAVALAKYDLRQWELALLGAAERVSGSNTGGLVNPTACITGPAGGGDGLYTVTVVWRGTIELPDNPDIACGKDTSSASALYSKSGTADNAFRRTVLMPVYITARQPTL